MQFGLDIPINGAYAHPRTLADLAADAEEAGWDDFFLQDVLFSTEPIVDPWVALAAVAMRTQRLRIGVFLTPLPRRRPWQVARQAMTLDQLSQGQLIFGAALGFQALDFTSFGEDYDPRTRAPKNWTRGWRLSRACGAAKPSAFMARITTSKTSPFCPSRCNPPGFLSGWRGVATQEAIPPSGALGWHLPDDRQSGDGRLANS
jgi:hypothetical protein